MVQLFLLRDGERLKAIFFFHFLHLIEIVQTIEI